MDRIKYDIKAMGFISIFEQTTGAKLKDCIIGDSVLTFIVQENEIARAIGKHGSNVKRLERMLKKKVRIVEFKPVLVDFIKSLIYPLQAQEISINEQNQIIIKGPDVHTKSMLIGRNASNLRATEAVVKRYFEIKEIRVI
ncbi:NusA-like transcription termination signal-binding factor [Candidatus Woesearchaeota archaeon]|nr:NusA-like transcription termination signal-binding factor [Candidatus Woesearchaeota archaeon]